MLIKRHNGKIDLHRLIEVEKTININLPIVYIKAIENSDGAVLRSRRFKYFDIDLGCEIGSCLGAFLCINTNEYGDLLFRYQNSPEFFPNDILAFGEVGSGDFICFDYREGKDNPNPPIVYWNHGADIGKDISFVAKDFETFIGMLKSDDEL